MAGWFSSGKIDHPLAEPKDSRKTISELPQDAFKALGEVAYWLESVHATDGFDVERRFEMVPPSENQTDVDTEVVAALRPTQLFGNYQIIFVSAGEEQGVRRGNRFFILRAQDEWRESLSTTERTAGARTTSDEPGEYPDEIIAEGRVVTLRPESAGLIITRSVREVEIGDRAEMRRGY